MTTQENIDALRHHESQYHLAIALAKQVRSELAYQSVIHECGQCVRFVGSLMRKLGKDGVA